MTQPVGYEIPARIPLKDEKALVQARVAEWIAQLQRDSGGISARLEAVADRRPTSEGQEPWPGTASGS